MLGKVLGAVGFLILSSLAFRLLAGILDGKSWAEPAFISAWVIALFIVLAFTYFGRPSTEDPTPDTNDQVDDCAESDGHEDLASAQRLAEKLGLPLADLEKLEPDARLLGTLTREIALKHRVFPLSKRGSTLTLAMVNPQSVFALDDVKFMTGYEVSPVVVSASQMEELLSMVYPAAGTLSDPWVPKEPPEASKPDELSGSSGSAIVPK